MKRLERSDRRGLGLFLALAFLGLGGCGILDEGDPSNARVLIEGGAGQSFSLVTSNNFSVVQGDEEADRDVILNVADTVVVSAPFNEQYSLGSGRRFYIKAFRDTALSEPINVRVLVGGDERYNATSTLEGLTIEFVYAIR